MSESRFSEQSDLYARYRPEYPSKLYRFIFEHLHAKNQAWDCATGSGQVAKVLSEPFNQVTATDISEEQLSHATQEANIRYMVAPAEDSGLPPDCFDLVTVAQAIHWFDINRFYTEVRHVAKEKALLAVIGYGMLRISPELNPIVDALYEEAFSYYFSENRRYLDQHYRNLPFPFEEIPTPEFNTQFQWSLEELEGYFNSWSAVQKMKSEMSYNPVINTMRKLRERLPAGESLKVTFPMFMRLGRITTD